MNRKMKMYRLIHENELAHHPDLAGLVAEIDAENPPVGYERLLYPHLFILPDRKTYLRLILDQRNRLIVPFYVPDESFYDELREYSRTADCRLLMVDGYRDWADVNDTRLIPLGVWQDIPVARFGIRGNRMRKLRYLVDKFRKSGEVKSEEYREIVELPFHGMQDVMIRWGESKKNVIQHSFVCMKELLQRTLAPSHRAFLTWHDGRLCSIIVVERSGDGKYVMDQEFYDPRSAPLGHMEYAVVDMIERLGKEGASVLSLGLTWYPFAFEDPPHSDPEGWAWLKEQAQKKTLLGKIFEQGRTNYQFKKKFGEAGEPVYAWLPADAPFSLLLHFWPVFFQNSVTSDRLTELLNAVSPLDKDARGCDFAPQEKGDAAHVSRKDSRILDAKSAGEEYPSTREDRLEILKRTQKIEELDYSHSPLDLMSDSWLGRRSRAVERRTAELESRRGAGGLEPLRALFPFKHLILTARGRDAEELFYGAFPKSRKKILTAIPWLTTLMHQLENGFDAIEIPDPSVLIPENNRVFKGELDVDALERHLKEDGGNVAMAGLELLSNASGGHPVRLSHIRLVKSILGQYGVPLVLDATRVVRNSYLIQQYEDGYDGESLWDIVHETFRLADSVVASLTKDFVVPVGGLCATNDDRLAEEIRRIQALKQQMAPPDPGLIAQAVSEKETIAGMVARQSAFVKRLQEMLLEAGVPLRRPAYGHAVVFDVSGFDCGGTGMEGKRAFLNKLFVETGIRGGIHQVGKQKNTILDRCVRLAFPLGLTEDDEDRIFDALQGFFVGCKAESVRMQGMKSAAPPRATIEAVAAGLTQKQLRFLRGSLSRRDGAGSGEMMAGERAGVSGHLDIAIIGLSGKYPQCDDYREFWKKIREGACLIGEVPAKRWDHRDYYDPGIGKAFVPHKTRCKFGAFLKSTDTFDAAFFNIVAGEVALMDPQERLALEVAWTCIEDAGYIPQKLGRNVGIFSGVTYNEFQKLIPRTSHSCFLNSRIAYFFNFQGPSVNVDTGCASSLTAIHSACHSLTRKECTAALVIGSNVILHPDHYVSLSSLLSTATEPRSAPFGRDDGWVPAEGVVAILLKPLKQALQDGDHVYAVVKSCRIGQEGKTSWFTASNPKRQAELIRESFVVSGIHPETISYVEAAANGSSLGDAVELDGLTAAFGEFTAGKQFCAIGSVKSNTGHGEAASSLLQLTKVLLQFKARTLFPMAGFKEENTPPKLEKTPFYFPESVQEWAPPVLKVNGGEFALPRRAALSSFGGGGNMGHLILEEYVPEKQEDRASASCFIPFSSGTAGQLRQTVENTLAFLETAPSFDPEWDSAETLSNMMFTLCTGRVPSRERVVFIPNDLEDLKQQMSCFLDRGHGAGIVRGGAADDSTGCGDRGDEAGKGEKYDETRVREMMEKESWHEPAELWVRGAPLDWEGFFSTRRARRMPLPTYCFQEQPFPIPKPVRIPAGQDYEIMAAYDAEEKTRAAAPDVPAREDGPERDPGGVPAKLAVFFRDVFSRVMQVPAGEVDVNAPFDRYGFDSIMVESAAAELERTFGPVPQTLFFECMTIRDVIDHLIRAYPEKSLEIGRGDRSPFPEKTPENPGEGVSPSCGAGAEVRSGIIAEAEAGTGSDAGTGSGVCAGAGAGVGNGAGAGVGAGRDVQAAAGKRAEGNTESESRDSVRDLARAILYDNVPAETILAKLA